MAAPVRTAPIRLIVGLGNPGPEYKATRHNVGAWLVDSLASGTGHRLQPEKKFFADLCKTKIAGQDIHLMFPTTFMNRSGQAVQAFAQFYKIPLESILVVHDELDIPTGSVRLKQGGGHGGHNGLRDISQRMGNQYARLRLGIGHPGDKSQVVNYVLSKPSQADRDKIISSIEETNRYISAIISGEWTKAMNELHRL